MTYKQEQLLKKLVSEHECPLCMKRLAEEYPKSIGCIFRSNNDEHLCKKAEKYMEGIGMKIPDYKTIQLVCKRCGHKSRWVIDMNDGTRELAKQLYMEGYRLQEDGILCYQCSGMGCSSKIDESMPYLKEAIDKLADHFKEVAEPCL